MSNPGLDRARAQQAVNMVAACDGNVQRASEKYGINRVTLRDRVKVAKLLGLTPNDEPISQADDPDYLRAQIKRLETALTAEQKKMLSETVVREAIIGLASDAANAKAPAWTVKPIKGASSPGVPTLFLSDLHWGEVVKPSQINGVNNYNLAIAKDRLRRLAERAVHLLRILDPDMRYPGIVIPLGGDMISGDIHDELQATNEIATMPTVLDLFGELKVFIAQMADIFGAVYVPCVTGNHGRNTHKIWNKDRHHTSFDWLLYQLLAKHFEGDKRITFLIPDGPDAYYSIFGHRYLLSHGDQFRGGDGMIGALGPIIRGDHKKRSRNGQIGMAYDTMILGHWHSYMHLTRLIVNGSLKGYDEYAYNNNFGFEPPQQALWVTHPKYRITYRMPVLVDRHQAIAPNAAWAAAA